MFDGTTRELKDVRYVPAMKKNLISLGTLEAKGYKIILEHGSLKVVKGALVILKGTRQSNLYYLQGSTVTGEASPSVASDSKARATTRLWHTCLVHTGEKSLMKLVSQ